MDSFNIDNDWDYNQIKIQRNILETLGDIKNSIRDLNRNLSIYNNNQIKFMEDIEKIIMKNHL